jgi:hypothetical protein
VKCCLDYCTHLDRIVLHVEQAENWIITLVKLKPHIVFSQPILQWSKVVLFALLLGRQAAETGIQFVLLEEMGKNFYIEPEIWLVAATIM